MNTVAFLGAKKIGHECLNYLINHSQELNIKIAGVLSKNNPRFPNLDINKTAISHKIPVFQSLNELITKGPFDFIISIQHNEILKQEHIQCAKKLAVNLHMAPLPEYRGCNQFSFAILEKRKEFGTTLHVLDQGIDSGDIIAEKRFAIPEFTNVQSLHDMTEKHSIQLFADNISSILKGEYKRIAQNSLVDIRGTSVHFRKEIESLKHIDPNWPEEKIKLHVLATSMPGFEPPFAFVNETKQFYSLNSKNEIVISNTY
jgi:methionyl-tRNA formyltransferase